MRGDRGLAVAVVHLTTAAVRRILEEATCIVIARDPELFRRAENLLRASSKIELMLDPIEQDREQF